MSEAQPQVLLWGGRSQARLVLAMLAESGAGEAVGLFDPTLTAPAFDSRTPFLRAPELPAALGRATHFIVAIGAEHGLARITVAEALEKRGLKPLSLLHARAWADPSAVLGPGALLMPGATVHKFTRIGAQAVLNTGCTVDHECELGNGVHIMGAAALAGKVTVDDFASVGTNATVLPGLRIGAGALVGAGAVVTKDVAPHSVVAGNPARVLRRIEPSLLTGPAELDRLLGGSD
jgi:sugar O-acyltransferase (sialic acid O-acetyltransferase NeuD family)